LFGLSPRRTNLMDPEVEFIQLVLPTSTNTEAVDIPCTLG